jgi:hypothetical protein
MTEEQNKALVRLRPSAFGMTILVIGLSLLVALTLGLVPLSTCPTCEGTGELFATKSREYVWLCGSCNGGKLPLLQRWIHSRKTSTPLDYLEWEGKTVSTITAHGFNKTNQARAVALTGIRPGEVLSREKIRAAIRALWETRDYAEVDIKAQADPWSSAEASVDLIVTER